MLKYSLGGRCVGCVVQAVQCCCGVSGHVWWCRAVQVARCLPAHTHSARRRPGGGGSTLGPTYYSLSWCSARLIAIIKNDRYTSPLFVNMTLYEVWPCMNNLSFFYLIRRRTAWRHVTRFIDIRLDGGE